MALDLHTLMEIMRKMNVCGVISDLAFFATPVWVAVLVGLVVGWAWRPRWAGGLVWGGKESFGDEIQVKNSNDLVFSRFDWLRTQLRSYLTYLSPEQDSEKVEDFDLGCCSQEEKLAVTFEDLRKLLDLVEMKDGGPAWIHMMDRRLPSMSYQAWRRDLERGPPQYRSRTIFDDARPETVRNFFWDDEFRMKNKWDDMLLYHKSLEECPVTGTMVVHWVRKFPFFCSDREYTIGRRIWEVDGAYYCVTKGIPFPSIPRKKKPRRVDLYYSSWCIRPTKSTRSDGHITACEVLLFHYEDMGIPWEIAKLGVRQGMWKCVKKIEPGLRAYQTATKSAESISHYSIMAQINTKVSWRQIRSMELEEDQRIESDCMKGEEKKNWVCNVPKLVLVGGALALACTVDRGLITKAIIFGVLRRFGKIGRRL